MGLNQEVEPSVREQSARLTTLPPSRRLSGFSRRTFLAGGLAAASSILGLRHSSAETSAETPVNPEQLLSDAVTNWSTLAVKEEALGELFELTGIQLTQIFQDKNGDSVLFQSMLVTLDEQGNPILRNLPDEMEQNGFDTYNVPPFLGDAAPQKGVFTVEPSAQITQMTAALGRVLEFNAQITGAGRFGAGGYNSYRIGDKDGDKIGLVEYYSGELPGIIRMAHFGHLAVLAGIVPEYFMLKPGELAQGGGGEIQLQPELPYPRRFTNADGSIVFNNTGDQVGLTIGDAALLEEVFTPLAKKYRPNGVEFFFYNQRLDPNSIGWTDSVGFSKLKNSLQNFQGDILYLAAYTNSFLGNTNIALGERPSDGVTEIHLGLFPKPGAHPTAEEIRELSFALNGTLVNFIAGTDGTNPDLREFKLALVERRIREENKPFPLTITLAVS